MNIESYELFHSILLKRATDESRPRDEQQAYKSALDMLEYAALDMTAELRQFDY